MTDSEESLSTRIKQSGSVRTKQVVDDTQQAS